MQNKLFTDFLTNLKIKPKNMELFYESVTHPSFSNEKRDSKSYQRLEFLGDAILEATTAEYIFKLYPNMDEGKMSIIRSEVVSGRMIASFAKELGLHDQMRLGNNSEHLRNSEKIQADIFEAFVAAIYLDAGQEALISFLNINILKFIRESKNIELKNPKTILQEFLQSTSRENIEYKTKPSKNGFEATVYHDGHTFSSGQGKTKQEAEVQAAENSLKLLKK